MTIHFGTDGWRAVISDTFTFTNLRLVTQAIADAVASEAWLNGTVNNLTPDMQKMVVGFDTRFLSDRFAGEVARVLAANNFTGPGPGWKEMPVPEGFDYDFWLGPAPKAPYHADRCFYRFRFIRDYSGGQTTNFGAHSNDVAHWAMDADKTGPFEIEDMGAEFPPLGDLFNTPTRVAFRARYASG